MDTNKKRLPLGLRYIRVLMIVSIIVFALILFSSFTLLKINSFGLVEIVRALYLVLSILVSIFVLYAIKRPSEVLYKTVVALLVIDAILSLPDLITSNVNQLVGNILSPLITLLIIWYFLKVKTYFVTGQIDIDDLAVKNADKKFKILFILWIIASFVVPVIVGVVSGVNNAATST